DHYVGEGKEESYVGALKGLTDKWADRPMAAQAWYLLASDRSDAEDSVGKVRAVAICERILQQKDSSEGRSNCTLLLYNLRHQELSFRTEKVNLPGEPMRALVGWRNFNHLYLRVIKLDTVLNNDDLNVYDNDHMNRLLRRPVYRRMVQDLPVSGD